MNVKKLLISALRILALLCVLFLLFGIFVAPKLSKAFKDHKTKTNEAMDRISAQSVAFEASQTYFNDCIKKDGADADACSQFADRISNECDTSAQKCWQLVDEISAARSKL
jgi:glucan phosphoethanolaminetransferase (alkaline phosphatase superfamily)